jgi:hypothetical protein
MGILEVECAKCRVSPTCPSRGSSPLLHGGKRHVCRVIGGYGRVPVDPGILSPESAARAAADGPCLTLAEVPALEGDLVVTTVVKVFSPPVLSDRETTTIMMDRMYPRSHD